MRLLCSAVAPPRAADARAPQGELQRTRGELSAALKRVAALQAEKASMTSGRAQAAQQAEERATRAEAAVEAARARLAEVHRLTAPGAEASAAPVRCKQCGVATGVVGGCAWHSLTRHPARPTQGRAAERVLLSSRGAAAAAAAASGGAAAAHPPSSLLGRVLRASVQAATDDAPAPDAAKAGSGKNGAPLAPTAATLAPPRWLRRANATAARLRTFPRTLGGRHFVRPEAVWFMAARVLAETPPGEEVRPGPAKAILDLIRLGAPADWAAACDAAPEDGAAAAPEAASAVTSSSGGGESANAGDESSSGATAAPAGEAAASGPRLRVVESASAVEGRAFALVRSDGVVAAVPSYSRALEALTELPRARDAKAERAAGRRGAAGEDAGTGDEGEGDDPDASGAAEREQEGSTRDEAAPARAMNA